jgi:NitT/TauT family transport system ATP-binding protein
MDEPFGALDSQTRSLMQELLLKIWGVPIRRCCSLPMDIDEAILLGDRVHVMTARPGRMKEMIAIDIARPRSVDVLTSAPFAALKRRIMALVHEEAVRAMG